MDRGGRALHLDIEPEPDVPVTAVHFIGFRGEEYWSAVRVWGDPTFVHIGWDRRAQREIAEGDVVVFARGEASQSMAEHNYPDLKHGPHFLYA